MSDTPRTDTHCITPIMGDACTPHKWEALQQLARTLERELASLHRLLQHFVDDVMPTMRALDYKVSMGLEDFEDRVKELLPELPSQGDGRELICDECHNADRTPEAREGGLCWREGCKGRTRREPHMEGNGK